MYTEIFHTFEGEIEIVFFIFRAGNRKEKKRRKENIKIYCLELKLVSIIIN